MKAKQPKQRSKAMQSSNDRYWKFRPMLDAMHVIADGRIDELTRKQVNAFEDCMMNHILEMLDDWPESDNGWSCRPISDTFLNRLDAAFKEERAQKTDVEALNKTVTGQKTPHAIKALSIHR